MVGQCRYSVPARLIGARVRVALSASELAVFDAARRVATHPRRGRCRLELDHDLEILLGKPGALPGSTALAPAGGGPVHRRARGVLGRRPRKTWRHRRYPGVDRGAAAEPAARSGVGADRIRSGRAACRTAWWPSRPAARRRRRHRHRPHNRRDVPGAAAVTGGGGDPRGAAPGRVTGGAARRRATDALAADYDQLLAHPTDGARTGDAAGKAHSS
jgi:hypothetical protein